MPKMPPTERFTRERASVKADELFIAQLMQQQYILRHSTKTRALRLQGEKQPSHSILA
jgi:hypothetical protein